MYPTFFWSFTLLSSVFGCFFCVVVVVVLFSNGSHKCGGGCVCVQVAARLVGRLAVVLAFASLSLGVCAFLSPAFVRLGEFSLHWDWGGGELLLAY